MAVQLAAVERHGELVPGQGRYSPEVRAKPLMMSSATIDRYLRGAKARDQVEGKSGTRLMVLIWGSRVVVRAADEVGLHQVPFGPCPTR